MPHEKDVYEKTLLELGHGLPIYEPDPAGDYDKVRIFDVGYVDEFGKFHRIFNAALSKEHEINRQNGTPAGFEPFLSRTPATYNRTAHQPGPIHSSHVQVIGIDVGISGYEISLTIKQTV